MIQPECAINIEESGKKFLLLADEHEDFDIFRKRYPEMRDLVVFSVNPDVHTYLEQKEERWRVIKDCLSHEDTLSIYRKSQEFMDSWYLYRDITQYKGLHLGELFFIDILSFEELLRFILRLRTVLELEGTDVVAAPANRVRLVRDILKGIPGRSVECLPIKPGFKRKVRDIFLRNPYVRYLFGSRRYKEKLKEIWCYFTHYPAGFGRKGPSSPALNDADVLVYFAHAGNVRVSGAPVRELMRRGHKVLLLVQDLDSGNVIKALEAEGFREYVMLGDIAGPSARRLYRDLRDEFSRRWSEVANDEAFLDSLVYEGVSLMRHINIPKYRWLVKHQVPYWALLIEVVIGLIESLGIRMVFATNEMIASGMSVAMAARLMGIPSVDVQHGAPIKPIRARCMVDRMFVWSENDMDAYVAAGMDGRGIEVTGHPGYDSLFSAHFDTAGIRAELAISDNYRHVILWAITYSYFDYHAGLNPNKSMMDYILTLSDEYEDCFFLLRPHPVDPLCEMGNKFLRENVRMCDHSMPVQDILHISSIAITWNSTVIMDAVVMNRPIIGMNIYLDGEAIPCVSEGVALEARDMDSLRASIDKILTDRGSVIGNLASARKRYVEKFLFRHDGMASSRVADSIESMMKR